MTNRDIIRLRLYHQQLVQPQFKTPGEVVKWLGAVQAQDYLHALWGIGQRLNNSTELFIEKAIADKTIVRTWPMRGTLHFVAPEDTRWMLKHLTPRIIKKYASMFRKEGLDKTVFKKCGKIFTQALQGGKQLTREELYDVLEKKKISTSNTRGLHILGVLAQEGLICFGPRRGKQHTFTLLEEWLPASKEIPFDEALGELALRYFTSHGPATIQDLAWWAGLTQTEAKAGLESIKSKLTRENINGKEYWFSADVSSGKNIPNTAYLMSVYDEYGISYKDRSVLADGARSEKLKGRDFLNMLIIKGTIAGIWKRTLERDKVVVDVQSLTQFSKAEKDLITKAVERYGKFLNLPAEFRVKAQKK
jgi:hypothetical protein